MDNLSGSGNWSFDGTKALDKTVEIISSSKEVATLEPIIVTEEITKLMGISKILENKYTLQPNKHLYDAIVSIKLAANSLSSINI
jgi:hypothetical protein